MKIERESCMFLSVYAEKNSRISLVMSQVQCHKYSIGTKINFLQDKFLSGEKKKKRHKKTVCQ